MSSKSHAKRPSHKWNILLVDNHAMVREGLKRIINLEKDMSVCGDVGEGSQLMAMLPSLRPDLVILDLTLEGGANGIEVVKQLRRKYPKLRILMLSMYPEATHAERVLRAGAQGYIMKRESGQQLITAIRKVFAGKVYVSSELAELLLERMRMGDVPPEQSLMSRLSDREFQIFEFIGQGFGTRQIADRLNISPKTVESHREHIREKLQIPVPTDLVQRAIHWFYREKDNT